VNHTLFRLEYSPSILEPVRPGAVSLDRTLCLLTFSHFVIVNKTFLSLFLSPTHPPTPPSSQVMTMRNSLSNADLYSYSMILSESRFASTASTPPAFTASTAVPSTSTA
jgi:hypothetical protein